MSPPGRLLFWPLEPGLHCYVVPLSEGTAHCAAMEAEAAPLIKRLNLKLDDPPVIPPPAPCLSYSGEDFGATIHLVCFGMWLADSCVFPWPRGCLAEGLIASFCPLCFQGGRWALPKWPDWPCPHLPRLLLLLLLQASASRMVWTTWAPCRLR